MHALLVNNYKSIGVKKTKIFIFAINPIISISKRTMNIDDLLFQLTKLILDQTNKEIRSSKEQ